MKCGEKETMIDITVNLKSGKMKCDVRSDPGSKENVHVSICDEIIRNDVDVYVEAANIAVPSISFGSQSQQTL